MMWMMQMNKMVMVMLSRRYISDRGLVRCVYTSRCTSGGESMCTWARSINVVMMMMVTFEALVTLLGFQDQMKLTEGHGEYDDDRHDDDEPDCSDFSLSLLHPRILHPIHPPKWCLLWILRLSPFDLYAHLESYSGAS